MTEKAAYSVGDNVLVKDEDGNYTAAETPGVIVGFMVRYPDAIDPNTVLASGDEVRACPKVYDYSEVVPEDTTIGELVRAEFDTLIKDTVQQVALDKRYEEEITALRIKEINLTKRLAKLEEELGERGSEQPNE